MHHVQLKLIQHRLKKYKGFKLGFDKKKRKVKTLTYLRSTPQKWLIDVKHVLILPEEFPEKRTSTSHVGEDYHKRCCVFHVRHHQ